MVVLCVGQLWALCLRDDWVYNQQHMGEAYVGQFVGPTLLGSCLLCGLMGYPLAGCQQKVYKRRVGLEMKAMKSRISLENELDNKSNSPLGL